MIKRKSTQIARDLRKENAVYKKAMRAKCVECLNENKIDCFIDDCALYPYRPYHR